MMDFVEYFSKRSKATILLLGIFLAILIGLIDYLFGWEVSFAIAFLVPIAFVTWFIDGKAGILVSFLAVGIRLINVFILNPSPFTINILIWNVLIRFLFFLITVYLINMLRNNLKRESEFARVDYLTGLANRRLFFEVANIEIERSSRYKRIFTLVFMDIDFFKIINDRFGHVVGDKLLCIVASTIKKHVRAVDTVARIGGDEFVILMPETEQVSAKIVTARILGSLKDAMDKERWPVGFSFGVVTFIKQPSSAVEMLKIVDELMYSAKVGGEIKINYKVYNKINIS